MLLIHPYVATTAASKARVYVKVLAVNGSTIYLECSTHTANIWERSAQNN